MYHRTGSGTSKFIAKIALIEREFGTQTAGRRDTWLRLDKHQMQQLSLAGPTPN